MNKNSYKLNTDGGARGNPGPAGIGGVIHDANDTKIAEFKEFIGVGTNNSAEYKGLIQGLKLAISNEIDELSCFLDSELIVKQLNGQYRVKDANLKILYQEVIDLMPKFKSISFEHVRREQNKLADKLVNEAIDAKS